ncbi:MAG: transglycosylase SLT domain-containing protein [Armatimonadota bacterium]
MTLAGIRPYIHILVLSSVILALATSGLPAQTPSDLDALVVQVHQSRCRDGLDGLTALAAGDDLEAQRAAFLAGWCLARSGHYQEAAGAYRAAGGHPSLQAHAAIEEGRALLQAGNVDEAARLLRDTAARTSGRVRGRALMALGQAELARKNPAAATDVLGAAVELRSGDSQAWLLLGQTALAADRRPIAERAFALAAWAFPGDLAEGPARTALARLRPSAASSRTNAAGLSTRRGRRVVSRRNVDQAGEFMAVLAGRPLGPAAGEAWYRLAGLWSKPDPRASLAAFQRAAALGANSRDTYASIASIARQLGLEAEAREAEEKLVRLSPSVWAARGWLNAGLRAEKAGLLPAAAAFYRRAVAAHPPSYDAAEARWRLGWIALRAGRTADAEVLYREAAKTAPFRGEVARAWYWVSKTMEARGASGSDAVLRMIVQEYPLTFYGQRARMRLNAPAPELAPPPPPARPRESAGPTHEELARLGLDTDAVESAEDALDARQDFTLVRFLAEGYGRLGAVRQSVALAEDALANGIRDETMWRIAYPKAFWPEVSAAAQAAGIDPLLLLALVREESRYDPDAISPARAVGLSQVLPSTAQAMTSDRSYTAQKLRDPAINLRLGARYLRLQLDRFGGDVRLALAAYNAGPGSARKWANSDADPDYFIEKIGIAETRAYVRRVLGSYGIYRLLWQ